MRDCGWCWNLLFVRDQVPEFAEHEDYRVRSNEDDISYFRGAIFMYQATCSHGVLRGWGARKVVGSSSHA
jgi:hypothetical protein